MISCLVFQISRKYEKCHHFLPEPKMTSSNVLFCTQPKDVFCLTEVKEPENQSQVKSSQVSFIYEAQNRNHIAILLPQTLDVSKEKLSRNTPWSRK